MKTESETQPPRATDSSPEDFDSIESVVEDVRAGRMVIVVDDEDRENEGDLIMAAEKITAQAVNFMVRFGW